MVIVKFVFIILLVLSVVGTIYGIIKKEKSIMITSLLGTLIELCIIGVLFTMN